MDNSPTSPNVVLSYKNMVYVDILKIDQCKMEEDEEKSNPKGIHTEGKKVEDYGYPKYILSATKERRIAKPWW